MDPDEAVSNGSDGLFLLLCDFLLQISDLVFLITSLCLLLALEKGSSVGFVGELMNSVDGLALHGRE